MGIVFLINTYILALLLNIILSIGGHSSFGLAFLLSVISMVFIAWLLITPLGSNYLAWSARLRDPRNDEFTLIKPNLSHLTDKGLFITDIDVKISDDTFSNAYAIGKNIVAVTTGLIEEVKRGSTSYDQLKGILAHELGHIKHGDSQILAMVIAFNAIGKIIVDFFANLSSFISRLFIGASNSTDDNNVSTGCCIAGIFLSIFSLLANLSSFILYGIILPIGLHAIGREEEYEADQYSASLGYGNYLADYLESVHCKESKPDSLASKLFSTHPPIEERVKQLRSFTKS